LNCSKFSIILHRLQDRTDINLFSFQHLRDACWVQNIRAWWQPSVINGVIIHVYVELSFG